MAFAKTKVQRHELVDVSCQVLFRADVKWFNQWRGEIDSHAYDTLIEMAMCNAMNSSYLKLKEQIIKRIVKVYDITKESLLDQSHKLKTSIEIRPAIAKSNQGGVVVSGQRLPVMRFNVIPNRPPAMAGIPIAARQITSVSTIREGSTDAGQSFGGGQTGRGRFVQRVGNGGHVGVFFNKIPLGRAKTGNYQIDEEFMISAAEMVRGFRLREELQKYLDRIFVTAFNAEMESTSKVMRKQI